MSEMTTVGKLNYDPKNVIGRGGFSTVFSGFHSSRPVAIKRLLRYHDKEKSDDQEREVEVMKKASGHQNILCFIHIEKNVDFL